MVYRPSSPTPSPIKQRLLAGASIAVIALASAAVIAPTGAMAQEIVGATGAATALTGVITSGATGGQFGAIDTNGDTNDPTSITLTQSETIRVFDSAVGGEASVVTNDFDINTGVTATVIFAENTAGADGLDADLTITGDLEGDSDGSGGTLNLSVRDGVAQDDSDFTVLGNTNMTTIRTTAGAAAGGVDGGNIASTFGNAQTDTLSVGTFEFTGGAGETNAAHAGGDTTSAIVADTTITTLNLTGGAGGASGVAENGGAGGAAQLTVTDTDGASLGAVTVTGGDGGEAAAAGNDGGGGGTATLIVATDSVTTTATTITIEGGSDGANNGAGTPGSGGAAELRIAGDLTATGGISLTDNGGGATLQLNGTADQTITAAITAGVDGDGEIFVNNAGGGQDITFSGTVGTDAIRIGTIDIDNADTVTFQNNVYANALEVAGTAVLRGSTSVLEGITQGGSFTVGGGTTASSLTVQGAVANTGASTIADNGTLVLDTVNGAVAVAPVLNADAAGSTTAIQTTGDATDVNAVTFNAVVGTTESIDTFTLGDDTVFEQNVTGGSLSATADVTTTLQGAASTFSGDITGAGAMIIGDANTDVLTVGGGTGTTSTISITDLDGPGDIDIAAASNVTFNTTVGDGAAINDFTMDDANSTITINGTGTTAITGDGTLTLDQGTIVLGSNIGANDTALNFNDLTHGATGNTTVQLAANFTNGTLTLIDTGDDETGQDGDFTVVDTALVDYTIDVVGQNIVVTAAARTSAETAAELGVSSDEAAALGSAVDAADTGNDDEALTAFSTALNTGGTTATNAAEQAGVQGDTQGGTSNVAFNAVGQQQTITGNRLASSRGGSQYGTSGFSSGDYYAGPQGGSYWIQGFGGIAMADGDSNAAGYDAGFGGFAVGADGQFSEDVTVGVFGSYTHSYVEGEGAGQSEVSSNTYLIGAYGGFATQNFYLDAFAAYAYADNESSRIVNVGGLDRTYVGDYGSSQVTLAATAGTPFEVGHSVFITPNAGLTWNHYDAEDYTETGTGALTASVDSETVNQLTGTVGARIHAVFDGVDRSGTVFIPELRLGVAFALIDDDAVSTAPFTGGGAAYQPTGTDTDDIGALLGLGLGFDNPDWSANLTYDADLRSDFHSHTARAEVRVKF